MWKNGAMKGSRNRRRAEKEDKISHLKRMRSCWTFYIIWFSHEILSRIEKLEYLNMRNVRCNLWPFI